MRAEHRVKRRGSFAAPLRAGSRVGARDPAPDDRPSLRLSLSRGTIGIELDRPWSLGAIQIVELSETLPDLRFPIDVSGGVTRFRHRRGRLERLVVEVDTLALATASRRALRGLIGPETPELMIAPIEGGALIGLRSGASALAFDVAIVPIDADVALYPERARGMGLGAPAHALAMRALAVMVGFRGRVRGGAIVLESVVSVVARELLPGAGARAPSTDDVRWEGPETQEGVLRMVCRRDAPPPLRGDRALRAIALGELSRSADQRAFAGDFEEARADYLRVLERAPRHPEVSRRLASIDAGSGDRAEAALATLVDAMPAASAGLLGGELLARVGDEDGARMAFVRAAHEEPFAPLASLAWVRVAELAGDNLDQKLEALDYAVSRAPLFSIARWARLEARLAIADLRGAMADVEHLEAAESGGALRHEVWKRAAAAFLARGFVAESAALFERALRYVPDSVEAVSGLARSLMAARKERRALDLFARAAALAERRGEPAHDVAIDLARGLVDVAGDRPAAIARVRAVPPGDDASFEARFLEGLWRAEIGDLAGASVALGRLADAVTRLGDTSEPRARAIAGWLVEGSRIEDERCGDRGAALRLLGLALRLCPRDRSIGAAFRRLAAEHAKRGAPAPEAPVEEARSASVLDVAFEEEPRPPSSEPEAFGGAEDEAAIERLSEKLRADPNDRAVAIELAERLARLGRDLDLLALLSAQMEDGDDALRIELSPRRREVLSRLAASARDKGRASEAEIYESMLRDA